MMKMNKVGSLTPGVFSVITPLLLKVSWLENKS
jgi:hypothetical protein